MEGRLPLALEFPSAQDGSRLLSVCHDRKIELNTGLATPAIILRGLAQILFILG